MILYKLNNNNRVSWWKIQQSQDAHGNLTCDYAISWGQDTKTINISTANYNSYSTPTPERAAQEIESLIKEQIARKGYTTDIPTTVPDLPMLAQKWEDHIKREPFQSVCLQPKLDGLRCLATHDKLISRRTELITSCPHISYILEHLSSEHKLDGELYIGGVDLQTIQSYVARQRPHRVYKEIEYHIFDYVDTEMPFIERYELLRKIVKELMVVHSDLISTYNSVPEKLRQKSHLSENCPIKLVSMNHVMVPTNDPSFESLLINYHRDAVDAGYEGAMVRNPDSPYELNYRSPNLLKFKHRIDDEFEIIDIAEGYGKTGIFVCKTPSGVVFEATPSWINERKRHLLRNKEKYIGRWVTVEFEKYSKDGTPLKTTAKCTMEKPNDSE